MTAHELVTRDDFITAGLVRLGEVLYALEDEGWSTWRAVLLGDALQLYLEDPSNAGDAGALPFWRLVKAIEETTITVMICRTHGMGTDQRIHLTFIAQWI